MRWMGIVIWREIVGKEGCNVTSYFFWLLLVVQRHIVGS